MDADVQAVTGATQSGAPPPDTVGDLLAANVRLRAQVERLRSLLVGVIEARDRVGAGDDPSAVLEAIDRARVTLKSA